MNILPSCFLAFNFQQPLLRVIEQPKKSQQITSEGSIMLRVRIEPVVPDLQLSYQWYHNDKPLVNQTSSILMIPNPTIANEGFYHCFVSTNSIPHHQPSGVRSDKAFIQMSEFLFVNCGRDMLVGWFL